MDHHSMLMDEAVDVLLAMRRQEETGYNYRNSFPRLPNGEIDDRLNVTWREKICQWSYNVVDHFDLSREVVAVSLNLFDRYLATRGNKCDGNLALLTSLTTLHIAIKLNDQKKIKMSTLANLSRGQFGPRHIEDMEQRILSALHWKLHPPTEYTFVAYMLKFLPVETNSSVRRELHEISRYLTELAVCDSFFVTVNNSTVAFAAILCVMEEISYNKLSAGIRERFLRDIRERIGMHPQHHPLLAASRERLRTMFAVTSDLAPSNDSASLSSTGSSVGRQRSGSMDSKSRYSVSPHRRRFTAANTSPLVSSRSNRAPSPVVASTQ